MEAVENAQPAINANDLEDGLRVQDAALNDIFELLATQAGLSYFHNNRISGEDFKVNGYLRNGDPLQQMNDLAFQYSLTLYRKGDTAYALTSDQLNQLPATEWHYSLRYMRPKDITMIKSLIAPLISPSGIVNFEPKTNTIVVIDTPNRIERVKNFLQRIDRAKGQIVVEVKIFRVNTDVAQTLGTNWASTLGRGNLGPNGLSIGGGINNLLGLPSFDGTGAVPTANDLVLSPNQVSATLRALNEANITKLENNPTLITEDNESASIRVIDRIPIITQTVSQGSATATVSEEVRYKIDESDPTDPENTREIGTTIFLTPTLLPDNTIRLEMRPRTASVTGQVVSAQTGNSYPQVRESAIQTIARIPDGHSLVVGGFFQQETRKASNKVPLLGDLPVFNFFFKSKEDVKVTSSLIFVVTPSSYDPSNHSSHHYTHNRVGSTMKLPCDAESVNDEAPGRLHEPNLRRTIHNIGDEAVEPVQPRTQRTPSRSRRFKLRR